MDNLDKYMNGHNPKKGQDIFYNNVYNFINSDYKYAMLRGGMGLGKCRATLAAIFEHIKNLNAFSKYYIASPFAATKESWDEEFHFMGMEHIYSPWIGKAKCTEVHGKKNCDFNDCKVCELCVDYLEFTEEDEDKKRFIGYTDKCCEVTDMIKDLYSNNKHKNGFKVAQEFYDKVDKDCMWHPVKFGLQTSKIVLGSYQATFANYFDYMTGYEKGNKRILILDEAQILDKLYEDYFSLKKNIDDEYIEELRNPRLIEKDFIPLANKFIDSINDTKGRLIGILREKKDNKEKYSYKKFEKEFNVCSDVELEEYMLRFKKIFENEDKKQHEEETLEPFYEFIKFLIDWKSFLSNDYFCYIKLEKEKYLQLGKKKDLFPASLQIFYILIDKKEHVKNYFKKFDKIIFMSGTIEDEILSNFGLRKEEVYIPDKIDSYSLKEFVKIYPIGDYRSASRDKTLQAQADNLIKIVNTMEGRTIIFLPSMAESDPVTKILLKIKNKSQIFTAANKGQVEKTMEIQNFLKEKDSVLLYGFRQGIEGQNLKNEDEYDYPIAVENIIFLGFPYAPIDLVIKEKIRRSGNDMPYLLPTCYTIHQNSARAKRYDWDVPCIVCLGCSFVDDLIQKYIHPDFYSENDKVEYDIENLLKWIKHINRKRNDMRSNKDERK